MAMTITINIDDTDEKVFLNDLLDVKVWVDGAVAGKQSNCWTRFQQHWTAVLMEDTDYTDPIPSNKDDFVTLILARSDYKNRTARDAESSGL